ncbi:hypothetical protein AR685_04285 [Chryseobacterium sp. JAH]|nr:hypothetical protein AR685_04285 [Chryseobacterium sp. JAH]
MINIKADSLEVKVWENYSRTKSSSIDFGGIPKSKFKYYIIRELSKPNEPTRVIDKIGTGNYEYSDNTDLQWNISNETKKIAEFSCQKAIVNAFGRDFTAWFTREIPINDGS